MSFEMIVISLALLVIVFIIAYKPSCKKVPTYIVNGFTDKDSLMKKINEVSKGMKEKEAEEKKQEELRKEEIKKEKEQKVLKKKELFQEIENFVLKPAKELLEVEETINKKVMGNKSFFECPDKLFHITRSNDWCVCDNLMLVYSDSFDSWRKEIRIYPKANKIVLTFGYKDKYDKAKEEKFLSSETITNVYCINGNNTEIDIDKSICMMEELLKEFPAFHKKFLDYVNDSLTRMKNALNG